MAWVSTRTLCLLSLASFVAPNRFNPLAVLQFVPGVDNVSGTLFFHPVHRGVSITGEIRGLSPGLHGIHVHAKGDLGNQCADAGGHFNPFNTQHGGPTDAVRHVGDLGNVVADEYGVAHIDIFDNVISLDRYSPAYIGGLAMVVHQGTDDLGRGGNDESLRTGNAGMRSGCGIIQIQRFSGQGNGRGPVYYNGRKW